MTDELAIQSVNPQVKRKDNTGLYTVGGAVVGAGAGALANHYTLPKPQYSSLQDLIDEKKDTFDGKVANASDDTKGVWQKAKEAREAGEKAGKKWDADLEKFIEANKEGATPELPADHDLMKQKSELESKIKELEGKTTSATTTAQSKEPLSAIRHNVKELNKAKEEVDTLKAQNAEKEAIEKAQARVKTYQERLNNVYDKIVEKTEFKGTAEEVEKAKKQFKGELEGYAQEYMHNYDKYTAVKPANGYLSAKEGIAKEKNAIKDTFAKIKEASGYDLSAYADDTKRLNNRINTIKDIETNKINTLKEISKKYPKVPTEEMQSQTLKQRILELLYGPKPKVNHEKQVEDFIKNLTEREKTLLSGKDVNPENIKQLIEEANTRLKTVEDSANAIKTSNSAIAKLEQQIADSEKAVRQQFGKGAYINKEGIVCKNGKPVQKEPQMKLPKFNSKTELPKTIDVTAKAVDPADTKALSEARASLKTVEGKITEARNALPKVEGKPAEELKKEFLSKYGERKDAVNKAAESFKDDIKTLLERKGSTGRLAAWLAGGAVVLGGLGYLLAPKNKN